jgi:hypothetical protein
MGMTMADLGAFLTARYDERQYAAEAAERTGRWEDLAWPGSYGIIEAVATEHILAWSPKFVLADIAAKRDILNHCQVMAAHAVPGSAMAQFCKNILRAAAAPYVEHPDFQPEWSVA